MAKWKGTVVPNSGYVEKVYFNTNLSVDEVVSICETLTFVPVDGYDIWACFTDSLMSNGIAIMRIEGMYYAIVHKIDGESNFLFSNFEEDDTTIGWQEGVTGVVEFNMENQLSVVAPYLGFTPENEKAAKLFSITPFTQVKETTADKLQKLIDGKQYVIDKTNAKAGTSLNIKSKWKDIGDVIEGIESGGNALIKGDLKGTVVPNEGYVEKVYLNTSLSVDEIVDILSQLTLVNNGYGIVSNESETLNVIVLQEEGVFGIVDFVTETYYFVNNDFLGFVGWNPAFNGIIEVNSDVIAQNSSGDSFGTQNNLLTKLFSITPFTQSTLTLEGEYDGSTLTITELPKGGWQGTVVPNSGTIEKIYVNTSLSVDEVVNILNNIDYTENEPTIYQTYPVIANSIMAILYVENFGDGTINIEITSGEFAGNVFNVETGWNEDFNGIIEFDNEAVSQIDGGVWGESDLINVGTQNHLLTSLFSTTPFTQPNAIDIKSLIENDKRIPLQIKLEGIGGGQELADSIINGTIENLTTYVEEIPSYKLQYCVNLKSVNAPNATKIGGNAFNGCSSLKTVDAPNAAEIGQNAFYGCSNLESVNLPLVTTMRIQCFYACKNLTSIDLPLVNDIENQTFDGCEKLESVNLPLVTTIESYTFNNCKALTSVNLPLTSVIYSYAFDNCKALTSVNLPLTRYIDTVAFRGCSLLTDLYIGYEGVTTLTNINVFNNGATNTTVHVRANYADQYATATNWSSLIESGRITIVGDYSD